ncbi:hypothetical protein FQN52_005071 [Onygenales sp. PD_12]|nr:hypothetical protein FQN52_005071 [Onygenales sp. PD_12]
MAESPTTITPETKKKKAPPVRAKSAKDPNIRMKMSDPFNQDAFKNVVVAPVELPPAPVASPPNANELAANILNNLSDIENTNDAKDTLFSFDEETPLLSLDGNGADNQKQPEAHVIELLQNASTVAEDPFVHFTDDYQI